MNEITDGWALKRCGHVTASSFSDVLAKGQGKTRASYMRRVVAEILTGKPMETYKNAHMDRGVEQEQFARMEYEAATGNAVIFEDANKERLFVKHPKIKGVGCSPDGLIDLDGGGEFKSVIPTVQVETILGGGYPSEHKAQAQGNLWITDRAWWDFGSYSPDFKDERLRLYVFRVKRDEEYIKALETEVVRFVREVEQMCDLVVGRGLETQLRASLEAAA